MTLPKFKPDVVVMLRKSPSVSVLVQIEEVTYGRHGVMYHVREIASRNGYPCLEPFLRSLTEQERRTVPALAKTSPELSSDDLSVMAELVSDIRESVLAVVTDVPGYSEQDAERVAGAASRAAREVIAELVTAGAVTA